MNLRLTSLALALTSASALFMSSCVAPGDAYVGTTTTIATHRPYAAYGVTYAEGYAGRGYYYGPPNLHYYSRQPGVVYYRTRESVPSHYWSMSRDHGRDYGHDRDWDHHDRDRHDRDDDHDHHDRDWDHHHR